MYFMKTGKKIGYGITGIITVCIVFSCNKKLSPSWDTNILVPVLNASMSINNILTSNIIQKNPVDSSIMLVYTDSLYNLNLDSLLKIPDTALKYDYQYVFSPTTVTPGSLIFETPPTTTTYPLGSVELTKGILHSGYLHFNVRNHLSQPVDYFYRVLNVIRDGTDTLGVTLKVPANTTISDSVSLDSFDIDFTGPSHNSYNDITTEIKVYLDASASPLTVNTDDSLASASVTFLNIVPYYAQGFFGTTTKTYSSKGVSFPVFNDITSGNLFLQNVTANLTLINGFGVDARIFLNQLSSVNVPKNSIVNMMDNGLINTTININSATQTYNSIAPVSPSVMNFSITPGNSNIIPWLDNLPTAVGYSAQVTTDPLGNLSGSHDFAFLGYGISFIINLTLPLSLVAQNLTLTDTIPLHFSSGDTTQYKQVKSAAFTLYAGNGFPFSAAMKLYLINAKNIVEDSILIIPDSITRGVMSNGKVVSPQNSVLKFSLNTYQAQEFFKAKELRILARFNMGCISCLPPQYIKIYSYYLLTIKLVGNFDYLVTS